MGATWSLFTGAMGLDLGLEAEGLHASLAVDNNPVVCETIRRNRPGVRVLERDVASIDADELRAATGEDEVDFMVGGPPCQSFSPGGKRAALADPRGNLIFEYLRLVSEVRPKRFALENVSQLITAATRHRPIAERPGKSWNLATYNGAGRSSADGAAPLAPDEQSGSALRLLLETAVADLGYSVSFAVLDASLFGAPQKRLRFVLIGDRDGRAPRPPMPTHGEGLAPLATVREAIADIAASPGAGSAYTPEVGEVFDLVPEGGNWRDLPDDVARRAMGPRSYAAGGGKTGFFRRLGWDRPAPTIVGRANRKGSALCHPEQSRPLSIRECARLQGFSDDWEFAGSMGQQYAQVGNAVPIALGRAIGRMLLAEPAEVVPGTDALLAAAHEVVRASARNTLSRLPAAA